MTKEAIQNAIAPCSILCYTCFGYIEGGIRYHAKKLFELHKGWYSGHVKGYGEHPTEQQKDKLKRIELFNEMLKELYTKPECPGCLKCSGQSGGCLKGCIIPACAAEHGVLFCADCEAFPCDKEILPRIKKTWLEGNRYIKQFGFEKYFEDHKHIPHYHDCIDPNLE